MTYQDLTESQRDLVDTLQYFELLRQKRSRMEQWESYDREIKRLIDEIKKDKELTDFLWPKNA